MHTWGWDNGDASDDESFNYGKRQSSLTLLGDFWDGGLFLGITL